MCYVCVCVRVYVCVCLCGRVCRSFTDLERKCKYIGGNCIGRINVVYVVFFCSIKAVHIMQYEGNIKHDWHM